MKIIYAITLSFLFLSCSERAQESQEAAEVGTPAELTSGSVQLNDEQIALAEIKLGPLQKQMVSDFVECSGTITLPPQNIVTVNAPIGGFVERVNFLPGDFVKKGALLAVLSHPEYIKLQQAYLDTQSKLTFAEQEYERQKTLSSGDASARKRLEESASNFKSLQAQLMGTAAQLKYVGIRPENIEKKGISSRIALHAPISGYITAVNINRGKFVSSQENMYELIDKSHMHLDLNVFEKDIPKISIGQSVFYSLNENAGRSFEGKVSLIGQKMEDENRAFSVHVDINSPEDYFKPGMYTNAKIFLSADSVAALPQSALIRDNDEYYVYVNEGDAFVRRHVQTGAEYNKLTQIMNPESLEGQSIVIEGAYYLNAEANK
ncbi:cobalt-zinc-cadmium efflux system membrane fusion protein [Catalinimonas alkaloidigena]|uniref:efflux RND transporter periplasmic adaptor subunit n=1 Tax=Catalinimonas alkaloidigena TaxID=1075417 RepID=UPI002405DFE4|nr:efflux RND transporter periplasmic adaptor subunit [Catalinimonas alkaloidigena]MDF9795937.1 cobalt-zinc-cadmium efflux system membrane fusion protein [Catalinimonas alkaloidigena]